MKKATINSSQANSEEDAHNDDGDDGENRDHDVNQ